nr:VOC family protein [Neobacillus sp. Marseille-Q6967]
MRVHHFGIEVKDLDRSASFYKNLLGFREIGRMTFLEENILFLQNQEIRIELISGGKQDNHQATHICFEVNCLDDVIRRFNENGMKALEGPYQLKNGWKTVFYEGPDHEIIEFLQVSG